MRQTNWIDFAKGVAIFLVVLGHAIRGIKGSGLPIHSFWLELDALIYAFHMPLFFALSGWFYVRSIAKRTFVSFAANRLERVVYPMILWTYIFFGCKFLAGSHANSPITAGDFPLIPLPGILHFWFLWDLLVLSFMAYPLRFALRNDGIAPTVHTNALNCILLDWIGSEKRAILSLRGSAWSGQGFRAPRRARISGPCSGLCRCFSNVVKFG